MIQYIVKRLLLLVPTLFGVSLLAFLLMHMIPGDPAEILLRQQGTIPTPEAIEKFKEQMNLDDPLPVQYFNWLSHLLHGDLGSSLVVNYGRPVFPEILLRLPRTLELAAVSLIISLLISIPLGIIASVKQNSITDYLTLVGASIGVAIPGFWLGLLLILLFSIYLGWFPVCGYGSNEYIILPSVTLGIGMASLTTRLMRASMLEVLDKDYIKTARGKGLKEYVIIVRHAIKNALIPVITVAGLQFGWLLEGAVFVEVIFSWPGIGKLLIDSISVRDIPMVQGCVLFITFVYVLVNLAVDISYSILDPRVRYKRS